MNEQFEKLRNEAFRLTEWETLDYDAILEKFGELIVEKCIDIVERHGSMIGVDYIKEHFGVEE